MVRTGSPHRTGRHADDAGRRLSRGRGAGAPTSPPRHGWSEFKETYPDRFFDVGIAEQNLIDFTAGLALEGLRPFAVGLAAMVPMRPAEQMRAAVGYMKVERDDYRQSRPGCVSGRWGNTHYAMDDIAVVRAIPNFTVVSPSDPLSTYKALYACVRARGAPVYVRLTGGPGYPVMYPEDFDFQIGKAIEYRTGSDVAFVSNRIAPR